MNDFELENREIITNKNKDDSKFRIIPKNIYDNSYNASMTYRILSVEFENMSKIYNDSKCRIKINRIGLKPLI